MTRQVYTQLGLPETVVNETVVKLLAQTFFDAVVEGFGGPLSAFDYDTPNYEMLKALRVNVYKFSAAKNYQQLVELSRALIGDDGRLRSYREFKKAALIINKEYVTTHLQAEYNLAVQSSNAASQWVRIEETKYLLPLLKYQTAGDERVRQSHRELDDIVRPADDVFWDHYYPPNGWNCRCDVLQVHDEKVTPDHKLIAPEIPDVFKFNPGKVAAVFPPGHPYYNNLPGNVLDKGIKLIPDGK